MEIWNSVGMTQQRTSYYFAEGKRVICVPTMGNLHDGHKNLIMSAHDLAGNVRDAANLGQVFGDACSPSVADKGIVVVTHFVNRRQFNNSHDFDSYPHTYQEDLEKLTAWGVHAVFAPEEDDFFPSELSTSVAVGSALTTCLCASLRKGHFEGVALVVTKLLLLLRASDALFGLKDYQQWCVIQRLVHDLHIPTRLIGIPTVRDHNNLALSSRLSRLSTSDRKKANQIYPALFQARESYRSGKADFEKIISDARNIISPYVDNIEYLEFRHHKNLALIQEPNQRGVRLFISVLIAGIRLIDNVSVTDRDYDEGQVV